MDLKKMPVNVAQRLPRPIRHRLFRELVSLNPVPPAELKVKLATTQEELEGAFQILHDCYVRSGFMKPDPSGLRAPIYHALPSTSTLIAQWEGKVVGTISIIRDNPMGLPLDKIFDVSQFRARGQRNAEISALAITPSFRGNRGEILFPLLKYLYEYCVRYFGVDYMQIAVNPRHADFYEAILFFKPLQEKAIENYDYVNGAPAVGRYLGMRYAYSRFRTAYAHRSEKKDLFSYFTQKKIPNLEFPRREYFKVSDPVMTPALLDYFFNERTRLFSRISERERAILASLYTAKGYRDVLPLAPCHYWATGERRYTRFDVRFPGEILFPKKGAMAERKSIPILVRNVSLGGFSARLTEKIRYGRAVHVRINVGPMASVEAEAYPVSDDSHGTYGFSLEKVEPSWSELITYLEKDLKRESA